MGQIQIIHQPDEKKLAELKVLSWAIWEKEISEFSWYYDTEETCYFLEGEVEVILQSGEIKKMGKGDIVTFPEGLHCKWKIIKDVKKHYSFA